LDDFLAALRAGRLGVGKDAHGTGTGNGGDTDGGQGFLKFHNSLLCSIIGNPMANLSAHLLLPGVTSFQIRVKPV